MLLLKLNVEMMLKNYSVKPVNLVKRSTTTLPPRLPRRKLLAMTGGELTSPIISKTPVKPVNFCACVINILQSLPSAFYLSQKPETLI